MMRSAAQKPQIRVTPQKPRLTCGFLCVGATEPMHVQKFSDLGGKIRGKACAKIEKCNARGGGLGLSMAAPAGISPAQRGYFFRSTVELETPARPANSIFKAAFDADDGLPAVLLNRFANPQVNDGATPIFKQAFDADFKRKSICLKIPVRVEVSFKNSLAGVVCDA